MEDEKEIKEEPKIVKKKEFKKIEKQFNWKNNLRSLSVKSPISTHSGTSYNGIIEKFGKLNLKEKRNCDIIFLFHNPYLGIEKKVKEVYKVLDKKTNAY